MTFIAALPRHKTALILSHLLVEESCAFAFLVNAVRQGSVNAKELLYRFAQGLHQEIPCDINIQAILLLGGSTRISAP